VEKFLRERYEFFSDEFVRYMQQHGYSVQTAYNWLSRLIKEGKIRRKLRNKAGIIYVSLIYEKQ